MKKLKIPLPFMSFCGIYFGNSLWKSHFRKCNLCKKQLEIYKKVKEKEFEDNWSETCACGCGQITKCQNKYVLGHSLKKVYSDPEWLRKRSDYMKTKNPMFLSKTRKKMSELERGVPRPQTSGDKNPAKRQEVRLKISCNNSMKNTLYRKKTLDSLKKYYTKSIRKERSLYLKKHNPSHDKVILEKRIATYSKRLSEGLYHIKNNWVTGYYSKKDGTKEWYDSSYEKEKMKFYDENKLFWTKRHGIRIPYTNDEGLNTYYIPDFIVMINGKIVIEEIKGWIKKDDIKKAQIAVEYFRNLGWSYLFYLGKNSIIQEKLSYIHKE